MNRDEWIDQRARYLMLTATTLDPAAARQQAVADWTEAEAQDENDPAAINPQGEPDERPSEDRRDEVYPKPTRSTSSGGAVWKSLLSATGGFGCERQTFYREEVRAPDGRRLDFGMGEPVLFGIAVDVAHRTLMEDRWAGRALSESRATDAALSVAQGRSTDHPWTDDEWLLLGTRVHLAAEKLTGAWPNRVTETGVSKDEPDGTPPGPPLTWLDADTPETYIEAQTRLEAPDVVGGRGISGKPDYTYRLDGLFTGWADIKALSRSGSFPAKWSAGEAVTYDYLLTMANGGVLPDFHIYLEYRRVAKPYWAVISAPVASTVVALARSYFRRWERALDQHDPDVLSFSPRSCAKCEFRLPLPELGFDGCAIGAAVVEIIPLAEEEE